LDSLAATASRSQEENKHRCARKHRAIYQPPVSHPSPPEHFVKTPAYSWEDRISYSGRVALIALSDSECIGYISNLSESRPIAMQAGARK